MSPGSLAGWGEAKMIDGWMWLVQMDELIEKEHYRDTN